MSEKPIEEVPSGDVKAELKNQEQQLRLVSPKAKMPILITHIYGSLSARNMVISTNARVIQC